MKKEAISVTENTYSIAVYPPLVLARGGAELGKQEVIIDRIMQKYILLQAKQKAAKRTTYFYPDMDEHLGGVLRQWLENACKVVQVPMQDVLLYDVTKGANTLVTRYCVYDLSGRRNTIPLASLKCMGADEIGSERDIQGECTLKIASRWVNLLKELQLLQQDIVWETRPHPFSRLPLKVRKNYFLALLYIANDRETLTASQVVRLEQMAKHFKLSNQEVEEAIINWLMNEQDGLEKVKTLLFETGVSYETEVVQADLNLMNQEGIRWGKKPSRYQKLLQGKLSGTKRQTKHIVAIILSGLLLIGVIGGIGIVANSAKQKQRAAELEKEVVEASIHTMEATEEKSTIPVEAVTVVEENIEEPVVEVAEQEIVVIPLIEEPAKGYIREELIEDKYYLYTDLQLGFTCPVPAHFTVGESIGGGNRIVLTCPDKDAFLFIGAIPNDLGVSARELMNQYVADQSEQVAYKDWGEGWYAVSRRVEDRTYYRKCFVGKNIRWFEFCHMEGCTEPITAYINFIETKFR